jgi:hypothetical protein
MTRAFDLLSRHWPLISGVGFATVGLHQAVFGDGARAALLGLLTLWSVFVYVYQCSARAWHSIALDRARALADIDDALRRQDDLSTEGR